MTSVESPSRLSVEEVTEAGELRLHRDEWERLVEAAPGAELFETYGWITSWLAAYWRDRPLAFLFVRDGDGLVGLAPLLDDAEGDIGCKRSLVTPVNPHARRCSIVHDGRADEVLSAVLAHLGRTRRGSRLRIRCGDGSSPMMSAIRDRGRDVLVRPREGSRVIRMSGDWGAYLATRPRHLRRELLRKRNKLESSWEAEWSTVSDEERCDRAMTEVLRIERSSWKDREGTSMCTEPEASSFYGRLARELSREGRLRIELLSLDSRPVAHIFGAVHRGTYYALKTSYDEVYRAWSPGVVLFEYVIERAFDEGLSTFDFLGFESRWKAELANEVRAHTDACAFAHDAYRCRWDAVARTRLKPVVARRLPAVVSLRDRLPRRRRSERPLPGPDHPGAAG